MSTTIRIDNEVVAYIKEHGNFGETHNDVLRRLLPGFKPKKQKKARRGRRATGAWATPAKLVPLVASVLHYKFGGEASPEQVVQEIGKVCRTFFNEHDLEPHEDGGIRWQQYVHFARNIMANGEGYIVPVTESGRGNWRLSSKGVEYAKRETGPAEDRSCLGRVTG